MTVYRCTNPFQLPSHREQSYSRRWSTQVSCVCKSYSQYPSTVSVCHVLCNLSLLKSYVCIPFPSKSTWHKVASQHHSMTSSCHPKVSPCHSLYHHVTLQEVHNLLQPLRVHGPPNKGITVPLDQEEGHSS